MTFDCNCQFLESVSFIAAPSTAALPNRNPAFPGASLDICGAEDSDKRKALPVSFCE
jgi:hypothetical protein